jgi:hypothetical protein
MNILGTASNANSSSNRKCSWINKQFKCCEYFSNQRWYETPPLNYDHGYYPCVWIQNLLDYDLHMIQMPRLYI